MILEKSRRGTLLRSTLAGLFGVLALYVLIRNMHVFLRSLVALGTAQPGFVVVGVALTFLMFVAAAGMYQFLSLHPLRYPRTLLIEFSAAAINRLLPGGVGALGVHGLYLYRQKHTAAQATAVVGVNNLLGITVHLSLLSLLFLLKPETLGEFTLPRFGLKQITALLIIAFLIALACLVPKWRAAIGRFFGHVAESLRFYRKYPSRLGYAALLAVVVSGLYTTVLYVVVHSLGLTIGALPAFIVFSLSVLAATATPTPGGLVGAEAGLYLGFVSYGYTPEHALSATLLFRLITYWLPIVPGLCCLFVARRRKFL